MRESQKGVTVFIFLASFLFSIALALGGTQSLLVMGAMVLFAVVCASMKPVFLVLQPLVTAGVCLLITRSWEMVAVTLLAYVPAALICGLCFRKNVPFKRTVLICAAVLTGITLATLLVTAQVELGGISPSTISKVILGEFDVAASQYKELLETQKVPMAQLADLLAMARNLYLRLFSSAAVVMALFKSAVTAILGSLIAGWLMGEKRATGRVKDFAVSKVGAGFFCAAALLSLFASSVWGDAALNLLLIVGAPLLFQGILCLGSLLGRVQQGFGMFLYLGIFWLIILMSPVFLIAVLSILGAVDCFFNIRKLKPAE